MPVRVSRGKGLKGPVTVELVVAPHIQGLTADPVQVPADQDHTTLSLRFATGGLGNRKLAAAAAPISRAQAA